MKTSIRAKYVQVIFLCILFGLIAAADAAIPWLHTDGNKIKDPAGNVVVLRGVALVDLGHVELWREGVTTLIDRLTDETDTQGSSPGWYTRVVRLAVYPSDQPDFYSPWFFDDDPDYYYNNLLRPVVDYCASKGLYVIIDWHYIADTGDHVTSTSQFWEYIAPRFANDSHVLFELFNEPINDIDGDWIGHVDDDWRSVRNHMQIWYDIVRTYAPDNLVLVAGAFYSQFIGPAATYPLTGDNIVIVSHIYPGHWCDDDWSWWYQNQITTCAAVYPVMMTEWGFSVSNHPDPNDLLHGTITEYGQPLMDFLELHEIGNTAWCADHSWGPPMFWGNWTLRCGDGEMGCFVKDTLYLRRNDDQPRWLYGDFTGEGIVNMNDLSEFCEIWWLENDCNETAELDLNDDCLINFYEYSFFAQNWLIEVP